MNVLVISGSTRRGSLNTRLGRLVAELRPSDMITIYRGLARLPFYDADLEAEGAPLEVGDLRAAVASADVVVITTPEYNGTIPGLLANALDWLSRPHGRSALRDKPLLVLSASPSPGGGKGAAEHLRAVLSRIGADVRPGFSVPAAHRRLTEEPDGMLLAQLGALLDDVLDPALRAHVA
jgi:chromate reductase